MEQLKSLLSEEQSLLAPSKHEYEYQQLCLELEPYYGKVVWSLVHKPFVTEYKLRKAHDIAVKKGIVKLPFLIGILKRL